MAKDKPAKYWRFKLDTRRKFTELSQEIARINSGSGADIDLTDYATKVWVEAKGYITASALTPYALKTDIPSLVGYATEDFVNNKLGDYATKDFVDNKLVDYAPLTSVQGFENRIGGLEGAVPQLNERVETVESKVATLNEYVVTGENNLLDRVNVIEEEYATKTYVDNAIDGIDLSPYLKTEDAEETYATKDFVDNKLVDYAPLTSVQGFENRIGGLEGAVPQLNERVETVESKVATLNEYVVTGENNLLDRVNTIETEYATKTYVDNAIDGIDLSAYLLKADLTKSRIQSTLGISDWALAATKPSYAWSEITSRPTALSQFTDDVVAGKYLPLSKFQVAEVADPSTVYLQSGIYRQSYDSHLAVGTSGWSQFITLFAGGDNWAQMYFSYDGRLHYRVATFGAGDPANIPWRAIITEKNIGNYNAGSATKLATPRKLWGQSFDGTDSVSGNLYSDIWRIVKDYTRNGTFIQSANYAGTSDLGNIYMSAMGGNKLTSFNVWANNSEFSDNVTVAGNVGIGTTSPTEKLDVAGNIKASGNINATSITINGVTITASNGSITVNGNVLATGSITAKKSA